MRMITFTKTPKIDNCKIITPPIYVRSNVELPNVGEVVKATSVNSDTVLMGEVIEVSESRRTYIARLINANFLINGNYGLLAL